LSGHAGVGKTYWALGKLRDECLARGVAFRALTPTIALAKASGTQTLGSYLSSKSTDTLMQIAARNEVIFVDEVGLCQGHELGTIARLNPKGLVLGGDRAQLANLDVERIAKRLNLYKVTIDLHDNDRYKGDKRMHSLLRSVVSFVTEGLGVFGGVPVELVDCLRRHKIPIKPLKYAPKASADTVVLGWRRRVVIDQFGGSTVHAAQGSEVPEGGTLHIVDWYQASPRLLYTAIMRGRSADHIFLYVDDADLEHMCAALRAYREGEGEAVSCKSPVEDVDGPLDLAKGAKDIDDFFESVYE
jgi:hypothetical protein